MSQPAGSVVGSSAVDLSEYERLIAHLREIMGEHGFIGVVASDEGCVPQPPYSRFLSGFHIPSELHPFSTVMVVPLEGEPALVLPPGIRRSFVELARARSWVANVVDAYVDDPAWELENRWGFVGNHVARGIESALRVAGLTSGRIGQVGTWSGIDATKAQLPDVEFVATRVATPAGKMQIGRAHV